MSPLLSATFLQTLIIPPNGMPFLICCGKVAVCSSAWGRKPRQSVFPGPTAVFVAQPTSEID
jgi:hypothetical protein